MKITLGELKQVIRRVLIEQGTYVSNSYVRIPRMSPIDTSSPNVSYRQQIGSLGDEDPVEEIAPHLMDTKGEDDDLGPVAPDLENKPTVTNDPYTRYIGPYGGPGGGSTGR